MRRTVSEHSHTALHIGVNVNEWKFVEKLLSLMKPEDLELKETKNGYTALHTVIVEGNIQFAKKMVEMNPTLTQICDNNGSVPLKLAADFVTGRQGEMIKYLWDVTRDENPSLPFSGPRRASLLCSLVKAEFYGT
ncbi:hypothetical protein MKW92_040784 [Papaver armeniacum]|nr:hypothetical protein MKW92_040784 [Papaver armeniacum]